MKKIMTTNEIKCVLIDRFSIDTPVQVLKDKDAGRTLYLLEHVKIKDQMSVAELHGLCVRIAKALDGELYGTVNIDFATLSYGVEFEMVVEVVGENATC